MYRFMKQAEPKLSQHYTDSLEMTLPHDSDLDSMLEGFELFLRGCGYIFDGKIEIVEEETNESLIP